MRSLDLETGDSDYDAFMRSGVSPAYSSPTLSYPETAKALLAFVPLALLDASNAKQRSLLLDALFAACASSKRLAERDACTAGCVWDEAQSRMREIML